MDFRLVPAGLLSLKDAIHIALRVPLNYRSRSNPYDNRPLSSTN
jgi:hypothetical protein